jgi:hypothetical protein
LPPPPPSASRKLPFSPFRRTRGHSAASYRSNRLGSGPIDLRRWL